MQNDLSRGGYDQLDGLESPEVDFFSYVSVCLSVISFYLAMWNAETRSVILNTLFLRN